MATTMLNGVMSWRLLAAGAIAVACVLWSKSFLVGLIAGAVVCGALFLLF